MTRKIVRKLFIWLWLLVSLGATMLLFHVQELYEQEQILEFNDGQAASGLVLLYIARFLVGITCSAGVIIDLILIIVLKNEKVYFIISLASFAIGLGYFLYLSL